jgi:hypothetical protein
MHPAISDMPHSASNIFSVRLDLLGLCLRSSSSRATDAIELHEIEWIESSTAMGTCLLSANADASIGIEADRRLLPQQGHCVHA